MEKRSEGESLGDMAVQCLAEPQWRCLALQGSSAPADGLERRAHHRCVGRRGFARQSHHAVDRAEASDPARERRGLLRSEEHTSELQSLMRNSYAVFCYKNNKHTN